MSSLTINGDSSGSVQIIAPAVSGSTALTLPVSTTVATLAIDGPAFSAYNNATQALTSATLTKVLFQVKEFDTANCFDNTTNYRFTPTVAGYYFINAALQFSQSNINNFVSIYKNGSEFKRGNEGGNFANYAPYNVTVSALIYLNGSTDYVEIYGYQGSASGQTISATSIGTYFQAFLARGA